jgi:hypothetical protein
MLPLLLLQMTAAWAHKPSYGNSYTSSEAAFEVDDPDISIVLYSEMTCESDQLWMHLETGDRDQIWVELGIPQLDRLEDWRPSLAIVGPDLPEAELPFEVPEGMGATILHTDEVDEPTFFFEEFTSTASWILTGGWIDVPPQSDIYLVAWDPDQWTGKLWIAVGTVEDFSDSTVSDFVYWMEATQAFHEVDGEIKDMEQSCVSVDEPIADQEVTGAGCSQLPMTPSRVGWLWFVGLLWGLRRRQSD